MRQKTPCWSHNCKRFPKSPFFKCSEAGCLRGDGCAFNHAIKPTAEEFHKRDPPKAYQADMEKDGFDWLKAVSKIRAGGAGDCGSTSPAPKAKANAKPKSKSERGRSSSPTRMPAAPAESDEERTAALKRLQNRSKAGPVKF